MTSGPALAWILEAFSTGWSWALWCRRLCPRRKVSIWASSRLASVSSLAKTGTLLVLRCLRLEYLRARAGWLWESSKVLDLAACGSGVWKLTRLTSLVKGSFPAFGSLEDDEAGEPREEGSTVGEPEDAAALERC